jgi:hypothetical protein
MFIGCAAATSMFRWAAVLLRWDAFGQLAFTARTDGKLSCERRRRWILAVEFRRCAPAHFQCSLYGEKFAPRLAVVRRSGGNCSRKGMLKPVAFTTKDIDAQM